MKASPTLLLCALVALCLLGKLQASSVETSADDEEDLDLTEEEANFPGVCWGCKWLINKVKKELGKHFTQAEVIEDLTKVCGYVPIMKSTCRKIVKSGMKVLVKALMKGTPTRAICVLVKACQKQEAFDEDMELDLGPEWNEFLEGFSQKSACHPGAV